MKAGRGPPSWSALRSAETCTCRLFSSTVSPKGVTLLGRAHGACDGKVILGANLEASLVHGEAWFGRLKQMMDDYAEFTGLDLPEEPGPDVSPDKRLDRPSVAALDLQSAGITSIIWATGYRCDFDWVHLPVFTDAGAPIQQRGVTSCLGLYFLGLRRMYTLKSALLSASGVGADAAFVAQRIGAPSWTTAHPAH
jgi:putative flavoprotein involved in K+ transport